MLAVLFTSAVVRASALAFRLAQLLLPQAGMKFLSMSVIPHAVDITLSILRPGSINHFHERHFS